MKTKRMLALLAAATMLFSTVSVAADEVTGATGSATTSGEATVNGVDTTPIYKVTLPTANALNFTVDPYNLVNLASGETAKIDTSTGSGAIIAASGSGAMMKNRSSVPVQIDVEFAIADEHGEVKLVTGASDEAVTATDTAMFLAVVPGTAKAASIASYQAADTVVAVTSGSSVSFMLKNAEYVYTTSGSAFKMEIATGASNYDAAMFQLGGKVNKEGEWAQYKEKDDFVVTAVFNYKGLTVDKTDNSKVLDASGAAVTTRDDAYAVVSGQAVDFVEDYEPAGKKADDLVVSYVEDGASFWIAKAGEVATYDEKPNATVTINGKTCTWEYSAGYIKVTWSNFSKAGGAVAESYDVVVTIDGVDYKGSM